MLLPSLLVPFLALAAEAQSPGWIFYAYSGLPGMLTYSRLDPILSPGGVSSHVHMIQGGNAIAALYDPVALRSQSTCTTVPVQDDLSNYWAPAMYAYDGASNYTLMLATFHVYYQQATYSYSGSNAGGSAQRYAFPPAWQMLAGDFSQRSINHSNPVSTSTTFQCINSGSSPYSYDLRDFQKPGLNCQQIKATTTFPSCWNGSPTNTNLTGAVYPNYLGVCPQSNPYAFMRLVYEWYWPVGQFPLDTTRANNWVLAFGDTSGFGFHGDFQNGWNQTVLNAAIQQCNVAENGIGSCAPFAKYASAQVPPCMPSGLFPDEPVGTDGLALTSLPGCNPLWTDNSTKPTCSSNPPTPAINLESGPNLSQWNYVSCPFYWQGGGRLLTAHIHQSWNNMTVDSCLAECGGLGYKYAMVEFGNNCICDNVIQNNGTIASDPNYACQIRCPSKYMQFCGGFGSGQLYQACTGTACLQNANSPLQLASAVTSLPTMLPSLVSAVTGGVASVTSGLGLSTIIGGLLSNPTGSNTVATPTSGMSTLPASSSPQYAPTGMPNYSSAAAGPPVPTTTVIGPTTTLASASTLSSISSAAQTSSSTVSTPMVPGCMAADKTTVLTKVQSVLVTTTQTATVTSTKLVTVKA